MHRFTVTVKSQNQTTRLVNYNHSRGKLEWHRLLHRDDPKEYHIDFIICIWDLIHWLITESCHVCM